MPPGRALPEAAMSPVNPLRSTLMGLESFRRRVLGLVACTMLFVLLMQTCAGSGPFQSRERIAPQTPGANPVLAPDMPLVPFHVGERLAFRVLWSKYAVHAARLEFAVVALGRYFSHEAWHFRLQAHTTDTTRMVYSLDDQFDSYTDAARLISLQYEMYIREQGKQQTDAWRITTAGNAAPPHAAVARVLPGTRDPIGLLYVLRATDWRSRTELRTPVFDGHHLYEVVARRGPELEKVTVPAGQFDALRIEVRVFDRGRKLSGTHFSLWLARDATRTPVLIEAVVPIGTARIELMSQQ